MRLKFDNKPIVDQDLACVLTLGFTFVLGAALRIYDLGAESYWFDEMIMVHVAQGDLESILNQAQGGRPPLYVFLAHFWMQIFGTSEAAARSLSALAGILSLPVMYAVGRELFDEKVATISTFLMAISEYQIHFSQEHRYYAVFLLMTLCSFLFYIRALRSRRLSYFFLYVVASILMFYSHTWGVLVLLAQNLFLLLQWRRIRSNVGFWFISQALILLGIGPGLFIALTKPLANRAAAAAAAIQYWPPNPTIFRVVKDMLRFVFPGIYGRNLHAVFVTIGASLVFFAIGTSIFAFLQRKNNRLTELKVLIDYKYFLKNKNNELMLLFLWLLCPILLPFIFSKLITPMHNIRYIISASPAFYLIIACGITSMRRIVPEIITLIALVILIAPGLQKYYETDVKEQWQEVATYIEERAEKKDIVVFAPDEKGWQSKCFDWYYRGNLPGCGIDLKPRYNKESIANAFERCTSDHDRFWIIMRGPLITPFEEFFLGSGQKKFNLIEESVFTGISVYLFELKA